MSTPRPKRPSSPPFAALRERLGIAPDVALPELEPVTGPALNIPERYHDSDGSACPGTFRLAVQDGAMWEAVCDHCRAMVCVAARSQDPQIERDLRLGRACLPERFRGVRVERDEHNLPVLAVLRDWLARFDAAQGAASLLPAPALFGLQGRGKSLLLAKACEQVVRETPLSALFVTSRGLLAELQRFDDEVVRGRAWERAVSVDVLALDDLGAEQSTDWRLDQLGRLVDERYQRELPILLATNFPPVAWGQRLDARTVSRLRGMTLAFELRGRDRRTDPNEVGGVAA